MKNRRRGAALAIAVAAGSLALVPAVGTGATSSANGFDVITRGLNNPRGLAFDGSGRLYVAEAGRGGARCVGRQACVGGTAALTRVNRRTGRKVRIVRGLPSAAGPDGSFATGLNDVDVSPGGKIFGVTSWAPPPLAREMPRRVARLAGKLIRFRGARARIAANLAGIELKRNPDGTDVNPNAYSLVAFGGRVYVADAGANDVLRVRRGKVSVEALIPRNRGAHAVPTAITRGPDGALYVGELTGGRPRRDASRVFRIQPGGPVRVHATGFNHISGIDFGPDGSMYVTELLSNPTSQRSFGGAVVRVAPDGTRTRLGVGRLFGPAGGTIGPDGDLYVANWSVLPARAAQGGPFKGKRGQVVRIGLG
jgi:sugar lactone lactonase YvrE